MDLLYTYVFLLIFYLFAQSLSLYIGRSVFPSEFSFLVIVCTIALERIIPISRSGEVSKYNLKSIYFATSAFTTCLCGLWITQYQNHHIIVVWYIRRYWHHSFLYGDHHGYYISTYLVLSLLSMVLKP